MNIVSVPVIVLVHTLTCSCFTSSPTLSILCILAFLVGCSNISLWFQFVFLWWLMRLSTIFHVNWTFGYSFLWSGWSSLLLVFRLGSLPLADYCLPFSEAKTFDSYNFLFWHLCISLILNSIYILLLFYSSILELFIDFLLCWMRISLSYTIIPSFS